MNTGRKIVKYSVAAAASVLILAISVVAYKFFSLSADKLYNEKYTSFDLPNLRGNQDTSVTEIEKAYRQKDYGKIINLSASRNEINIADQFLSAVSYLQVNRPTEAIKLFNEVMELNKKSGHATYEDDAEYYLALSYLKIREYDKALKLMNAIHENSSHIYHDNFSSGFILKVKMLKFR
jgi:tetratricopeptide (TPR) repeat protein